MLQRLPIALAQVKVGITSKNIWKLTSCNSSNNFVKYVINFYSLYWANKITSKVYGNVI